MSDEDPGYRKKKFVAGVVTVGKYLIATMVGSGALWAYLNYGIEQESQRLKGLEISNSIRQELLVLYEKIGTTSSRINELAGKLINRARQAGAGGSSEECNRLRHLDNHVRYLQEEFRALEARLARLEEREVRNINLDFIPPMPPGMRHPCVPRRKPPSEAPRKPFGVEPDKGK